MPMQIVSILVFLSFFLAACVQTVGPQAGGISQEPAATPTVGQTPTTEDTPTSTVVPTPTPIPTTPQTLLPEERPPFGAVREFQTDFSRHSVPYDEILSGGPPKDGIPAIDRPKYVSIEEADEWLKPQEPVIRLEIDGQARAYPLQILTWHEIANDTLADVPVAVTFCPLCNTAIAFERRMADQELTFGTTGRLRYSNLIMYDRQTESWWQQATGEGIVGEFTGRQLTFLPAVIIAWESFKEAHPEGDVLSRDTGHIRSYGRNPYGGYDDVNEGPFLYVGPETPDKLLPMARVGTVELNGEAVAYPYTVMEELRVVNDTVGGTPLAVIWEPGTASALDSSVLAEGRDVGTVNTFSRALAGQTLTFLFKEDRILDEQTGSQWNVLGEAVDGPLAGSKLEPVVNVNHFWFSWAAFRPETRIYGQEQPAATAPEPAAKAGNVEVDFDFDIQLYQGAEQLGAQELRFSELFTQGKPVVVNLWAGLCPSCRAELPLMQRTYEQNKSEMLFVGVDIGPFTGLGSEADGRALLEDLGITFSAGSTPDAAIMREYRVLGVPTTLFFASNGKLVDDWSGLITESRLIQQLESLRLASDREGT